MHRNKKLSLSSLIVSILCATTLYGLTGCSANNKYHSKKHIGTIKKDLSSMHKDIDRVLGLDEPSPLVDEP